jgi:hypothetical protein
MVIKNVPHYHGFFPSETIKCTPCNPLNHLNVSNYVPLALHLFPKLGRIGYIALLGSGLVSCPKRFFPGPTHFEVKFGLGMQEGSALELPRLRPPVLFCCSKTMVDHGLTSKANGPGWKQPHLGPEKSFST